MGGMPSDGVMLVLMLNVGGGGKVAGECVLNWFCGKKRAASGKKRGLEIVGVPSGVAGNIRFGGG